MPLPVRRIGLAAFLVLVLGSSTLVAPGAIAERVLTDEYIGVFDGVVQERGAHSKMLDRWFQLYADGKIGEADKVWSSILKDMAKDDSMAKFLENVNQRCWFAEDNAKSPGDARKARVDPRKAYEHLLKRTEMELGKEHRFVGDISRFLAMYAETDHDYKKARIFRLRELALHEKWLGESHEVTMLSMENCERLLVKMKNYREAEPLIKKLIANSEKTRSGKRFHHSVLDYIALLRATGRDTEARRVVAKYKTYMWQVERNYDKE